MIEFKKDAKFDVVSLGEIMLRLDPKESRIKQARSFDVYEGGGEYNVARNMKYVFNMNSSVITAFADNEVGKLLTSLVNASGIDTSYIVFKEFDGIGRKTRNGLNFTERGFGVRGALGVSDRGNTAISQLEPKDIDLEKLFKKDGVKILNTGGIYAGLSSTSAKTCLEIMKYAKENGTKISYDLNFRPSLWNDLGGEKKAQEVNKELAKYVDIMIGNEEDFGTALGIKGDGIDLDNIDLDAFKKNLERISNVYPNFEVIATTLRQVKTATYNNWSAIAWTKEEGIQKATQRDDLEIMDRVGGGDSFASGLLYGLLKFGSVKQGVEFGAAHGALAMTTPGDTSMASLKEVEKLVQGSNARVER